MYRTALEFILDLQPMQLNHHCDGAWIHSLNALIKANEHLIIQQSLCLDSTLKKYQFFESKHFKI